MTTNKHVSGLKTVPWIQSLRNSSATNKVSCHKLPCFFEEYPIMSPCMGKQQIRKCGITRTSKIHQHDKLAVT